MKAGPVGRDDLAVLATTATWAVSAVLMTLGALLLVVRRGRGLVVLGALVGLAGTAVARWAFDWFTPRTRSRTGPCTSAGSR